MRRAVNILLGAFANVGMANGLYSLYHTEPPVKPATAPTLEEAFAMDAAAIRSAWEAVGDALYGAMERETGEALR